MNTEDARSIPPWFRHFLVHVVKRSALILVRWIEDVQAANK